MKQILKNIYQFGKMNKLKFIAISGTTGVTENLYVYEYDNDIIIVDCGVGFPQEASFGIDLVIPDFSYLRENKSKVRALFVSHGHEDHYGAVPFLLGEFDIPVYASRLTAGFLKDKLIDYKVKGQINILDSNKGEVRIGSFKVEAFLVTHSVPDSLGFCITTPVGKIFHVSDYKFDFSPIGGRPFDIVRSVSLTSGGVLMMASDALGATTEGFTKSEQEIKNSIDSLIEKAPKRVFFTTISSNISRIMQAINASISAGRKVAFVGRSIESKMEIARRLGFASWPNGVVVKLREADNLPPNKITYIISGCYGQVDSALYRLSLDEHQSLRVEKDDMIIFSADPSPPGASESVNYVVDNLIDREVEVHYYDTQEDLHVSGHGAQKDIELLFSLVRPKYLVPIGGTVRHMHAYSKIAQNLRIPANNVFELKGGESIEFQDGKAVRGPVVPVKDVLVDGLGVGDVGNIVLRDRKTLAQEGVVVALLQIDKREGMIIDQPDLITRGFVFARENQDLLNSAARGLVEELKKRHKKGNGKLIREVTINFLEHFFYEKTARRPMILPVIVEV